MAAPSPAARTSRLRQDALSARLALVVGSLGVVALWWFGTPAASISSPGAAALAVAELAGLAAGWLICVQLLLVARIPWFERAVGHDRLIGWHVLLGLSVLGLVVLHIAAMTAAPVLFIGATPWAAFADLIASYPDMIPALIGTAILLAVVISSFRSLRRRLRFEVWYWLHVAAYAGAYLALLHQLSGGGHLSVEPWARIVWLVLYGATGAAVLVHRVLLPLVRNRRHRLRVDELVRETPSIVSIWIAGERLDELALVPGAYVSVRFDAPGLRGPGHPFSLSATPRDGRFRITVAEIGDGTRRMGRLEPGTRVWFEGPYTSSSADPAHERAVALIGGGVGIAPLYPVAERFAAEGREVVVLHRALTEPDLALRDEFARLLGDRYHAVPGCPDDLGHDPLATEHLLARFPDLAEREIYLCGSAGMMGATMAGLAPLGMRRDLIHEEEFAQS